MPDVDLPNSLAWLLAMGALAVAIYNVDRLAHYLRIPSLTKRILAAAFQPLSDMIVDRMQHQIDLSTKRIWDELRPNSGKSLRDAVDRTEKDVRRLQDTVDGHISDVAAHASDPTAHIRPTPPDDGGAGPR